jgi:hypothetical protein
MMLRQTVLGIEQEIGVHQVHEWSSPSARESSSEMLS